MLCRNCTRYPKDRRRGARSEYSWRKRKNIKVDIRALKAN